MKENELIIGSGSDHIITELQSLGGYAGEPRGLQLLLRILAAWRILKCSQATVELPTLHSLSIVIVSSHREMNCNTDEKLTTLSLS